MCHLFRVEGTEAQRSRISLKSSSSGSCVDCCHDLRCPRRNSGFSWALHV